MIYIRRCSEERKIFNFVSNEMDTHLCCFFVFEKQTNHSFLKVYLKTVERFRKKYVFVFKIQVWHLGDGVIFELSLNLKKTETQSICVREVASGPSEVP